MLDSVLRPFCQEGSGQFDYAEKLYQKSCQHAPHNVDAFVSYSEMLIRRIDAVYDSQEVQMMLSSLVLE